MLNQKEWFLKSTDGKELFAINWYPDGEIKGTVCLVHGASEHCGRYENVVKSFTNEGLSVYAIDLRGHGKTGGKQGHLESYEQTLRDIDTIIKKSHSDNPDKPLILYGHSMGGGLCLNYLAKYDNPAIKGAIISAPFIKLYKKPNVLLLIALRILSKIFPTCKISNGIALSELCSNAEEINKARKDPLFSDKLSARSIVETYYAGNYIYNHPEKIKVPFIIMHGLEDKVTSPTASKSFVERSTTGKFISYNDFKHEIHHEVNSYNVLKDMVSWIKREVLMRVSIPNKETVNIVKKRGARLDRKILKEVIMKNSEENRNKRIDMRAHHKISDELNQHKNSNTMFTDKDTINGLNENKNPKISLDISLKM